MNIRARVRTGMRVTPLVIAGLAGCGGDDDYCHDCGPGYSSTYPATEVSYGLVTGDFTGKGLSSIVATSTDMNGYQPEAGYLKAYLAAAAGSYAAPIVTSDGNDPLYLAAADLNGDTLPDIVSASFQDGALSDRKSVV